MRKCYEIVAGIEFYDVILEEFGVTLKKRELLKIDKKENTTPQEFNNNDHFSK